MTPATERLRPARLTAARLTASLLAVTLLLGVSTGCTASPASPHASTPAQGKASPSNAAGGASGAGTAQPPVTQGPSPTTLAGFYAQRLTWVACDNGFQCARLWVPFDYAHPGAGPAFSLPVIKLPATRPAQRIGPLVI